MRTVSGDRLFLNRRGKRNRPVIDGTRFDSDAEGRRYGALKLLQMAGEIAGLEVKPRLSLVVKGKKIGRGYMVLDFRYKADIDGAIRWVYEDAKGGADTREAKLRRQVAQALHPQVIIRVVSA